MGAAACFDAHCRVICRRGGLFEKHGAEAVPQHLHLQVPREGAPVVGSLWCMGGLFL